LDSTDACDPEVDDVHRAARHRPEDGAVGGREAEPVPLREIDVLGELRDRHGALPRRGRPGGGLDSAGRAAQAARARDQRAEQPRREALAGVPL